ncbi:hypothetical protein CJP74_01425 [Psittacicella melopsittaci]|uniref:Uncharacterized protein n=1 Tax=Psittacicella melopsittaci TaxID=2028576 RepID=A0A3A1Y5L6_9GAMM|nr:hypothetical protein [Psittacicella melopsittaci]RIY33553.1 hypothetical protein CJP74_01425 [Psittacicella melopsittaci]
MKKDTSLDELFSLEKEQEAPQNVGFWAKLFGKKATASKEKKTEQNNQDVELDNLSTSAPQEDLIQSLDQQLQAKKEDLNKAKTESFLEPETPEKATADDLFTQEQEKATTDLFAKEKEDSLDSLFAQHEQTLSDELFANKKNELVTSKEEESTDDLFAKVEEKTTDNSLEELFTASKGKTASPKWQDNSLDELFAQKTSPQKANQNDLFANEVSPEQEANKKSKAVPEVKSQDELEVKSSEKEAEAKSPEKEAERKSTGTKNLLEDIVADVKQGKDLFTEQEKAKESAVDSLFALTPKAEQEDKQLSQTNLEQELEANVTVKEEQETLLEQQATPLEEMQDSPEANTALAAQDVALAEQAEALASEDVNYSSQQATNNITSENSLAKANALTGEENYQQQKANQPRFASNSEQLFATQIVGNSENMFFVHIPTLKYDDLHDKGTQGISRLDAMDKAIHELSGPDFTQIQANYLADEGYIAPPNLTFLTNEALNLVKNSSKILASSKLAQDGLSERQHQLRKSLVGIPYDVAYENLSRYKSSSKFKALAFPKRNTSNRTHDERVVSMHIRHGYDGEFFHFLGKNLIPRPVLSREELIEVFLATEMIAVTDIEQLRARLKKEEIKIISLGLKPGLALYNVKHLLQHKDLVVLPEQVAFVTGNEDYASPRSKNLLKHPFAIDLDKANQAKITRFSEQGAIATGNLPPDFDPEQALNLLEERIASRKAKEQEQQEQDLYTRLANKRKEVAGNAKVIAPPVFNNFAPIAKERTSTAKVLAAPIVVPPQQEAGIRVLGTKENLAQALEENKAKAEQVSSEEQTSLEANLASQLENTPDLQVGTTAIEQPEALTSPAQSLEQVESAQSTEQAEPVGEKIALTQNISANEEDDLFTFTFPILTDEDLEQEQEAQEELIPQTNNATLDVKVNFVEDLEQEESAPTELDFVPMFDKVNPSSEQTESKDSEFKDFLGFSDFNMPGFSDK